MLDRRRQPCVVGGKRVGRRVADPSHRPAACPDRRDGASAHRRATSPRGPRPTGRVRWPRLGPRSTSSPTGSTSSSPRNARRSRISLTGCERHSRALRLESESLRDPAERERIATQASALERTLTAVIHAARRPQREGRLPSADATAVVRDRVAFWSALTDEQERACTLTLPDGPLLVRASAEDLAAAVDALIENVVAHTPRGHAVRGVAAIGAAGLVDARGARPARWLKSGRATPSSRTRRLRWTRQRSGGTGPAPPLDRPDPTRS